MSAHTLGRLHADAMASDTCTSYAVGIVHAESTVNNGTIGPELHVAMPKSVHM